MVWDGARSKEAADFITVVGQLADFTIFMDNFIEGRHTLEDPVVLTDSRNHSQHQLMSLPSSRSLRLSGRSDIHLQYESARLACIAYSLLVVFPLPPTVGLFEKLARGMRSEIVSLSDIQATFTVHERKLHFWTLTLAAILGTGLPERRFFLNELLHQAKLLRIADWPSALEVLKEFLWHPSTNNKDGHDLWTELESMQAGGE
jgi:hypothetical protein